MTMKEDVKHINWTGPLTNERVQSPIGWRKRVFVDCSKATADWLGHNATGSLMCDVECFLATQADLRIEGFDAIEALESESEPE